MEGDLWQTEKSPPQDGSAVDLVLKDGQIVTARWYEDVTVTVPLARDPSPIKMPPCWVSEEHGVIFAAEVIAWSPA